jgi:hypothetical protein
VYRNRGWHWYVDVNGRWHKLGRDWDRAARERWLELSTGHAPAGTVAQLLDCFLAWAAQEVREKRRAPRTLEDNHTEAAALKLVFARMPAHLVTRRHVATYLTKRSARVRANREIALLSSAYSWALSLPEWEAVAANPCHGVRRNRETPRRNYVESRELARFGRQCCPRWLRCYILLKRLTALRQGDMLRLMRPAAGDGWISARIGKAGDRPAKIRRTWGMDLVLRAIEADQRARGIVSVFLFPRRDGAPLSARGFKSAWARAAARWNGQKFREHDIRGKAASDARSLQEAQQLLAHETPATTARHYRAGVVRIKPRR